MRPRIFAFLLMLMLSAASCSEDVERVAAPKPCAPDTVYLAVHDTVFVDCDRDRSRP